MDEIVTLVIKLFTAQQWWVALILAISCVMEGIIIKVLWTALQEKTKNADQRSELVTKALTDSTSVLQEFRKVIESLSAELKGFLMASSTMKR